MTPAHAQLLRQLLNKNSVAALGTLEGDSPFVSMTPFAVTDDGRSLIVHVSRLAAHTRNMRAHAAVSLMVMDPEGPGMMPQGLARVTIQGDARSLGEDDREFVSAKAAYLQRFPQAADLFSFPDFSLFLIDIQSARFVGGFAQAMSLTPESFAKAVRG